MKVHEKAHRLDPLKGIDFELIHSLVLNHFSVKSAVNDMMTASEKVKEQK